VENNQHRKPLKKRADFDKIKQTGRVLDISSWILVSYLKNDEQSLRVGWTLPSYVGTAVTRNRLKRWIREYLNNLPGENFKPPYDVNLVFRRRNKDFYKRLEHGVLDVELKKILARIDRLSK
jgi:ribonuclease P protein component